jgi:hypothetical protein
MMMRAPLVSWRRSMIAYDAIEALRRVDKRARSLSVPGLVMKMSAFSSDDSTWDGVVQRPAEPKLPPELSMRPAGRQFSIEVLAPGISKQGLVELAWVVAVPSGFTPWNRYPVAGAQDDVFHYLGPWQSLYDTMLSEGMGELAWPSTCAAAQVDVGRWGGGREVERFVQAQLHRVGQRCGPVDGVITDRVSASLRSLGLTGDLATVAAQLSKLPDPIVARSKMRSGFISGGQDVHATSSGRAYLTRTPSGYSYSYDGGGRIIVDVDPES